MADKVVHRSVYPKLRSSGVKIDSELLKKVEAFIKKKENKYKYVNKKQFIDIAVFEKLKKGVKNVRK